MFAFLKQSAPHGANRGDATQTGGAGGVAVVALCMLALLGALPTEGSVHVAAVHAIEALGGVEGVVPDVGAPMPAASVHSAPDTSEMARTLTSELRLR